MIDFEKKISVLIVEDDANDRFLLQNAFAEISTNINVEQLYTGKQVLEFLLKDKVYLDLNRQEIPDVIIANVKTDFFWLEDLKEIRAHEAFNAIPIYLFSSYESALFQSKALESGANGFFKKPYTFMDLKFILNSILEKEAALTKCA
jgi:DNA-binding response OmpR family regulator